MTASAARTVGVAGTVCAAVLMLGALAVPARADYRDGCPVGTTARAFRAEDLGAAPDRESVLTPTRIELGFGDSYYTSRSGVSRARVYTFTPHLQYNLSFDDRHAVVVQVWSAGLLRRPDAGIPTTALWGNTFADIAYRRSRLTYLDPHEHMTIPTLREAFAVQVFGGRSQVDPDPMSRTTDITLLRELAVRSAFDGYLFDPGWVAGAALEARYEIVGCLAPFFHLRFAPMVSGLTDSFQILTGPITATIGISAGEDTSIYIQYGLALRRFVHFDGFTNAQGQTMNGLATFSTQRVRFGVDWHGPASLHLGANIEYASAQDGIFTGVYIMRGWEP